MNDARTSASESGAFPPPIKLGFAASALLALLSIGASAALFALTPPWFDFHAEVILLPAAFGLLMGAILSAAFQWGGRRKNPRHRLSALILVCIACAIVIAVLFFGSRIKFLLLRESRERIAADVLAGDRGVVLSGPDARLALRGAVAYLRDGEFEGAFFLESDVDFPAALDGYLYAPDAARIPAYVMETATPLGGGWWRGSLAASYMAGGSR